MGRLVVGKLEGNAKLNSKLRLKLKLELSLAKSVEMVILREIVQNSDANNKSSLITFFKVVETNYTFYLKFRCRCIKGIAEFF